MLKNAGERGGASSHERGHSNTDGAILLGWLLISFYYVIDVNVSNIQKRMENNIKSPCVSTHHPSLPYQDLIIFDFFLSGDSGFICKPDNRQMTVSLTLSY